MNIGSVKHVDNYYFSSRIEISGFQPLSLLDAIKISPFPM